MTQPVIRKAEPHDAPALTALGRKTFTIEFGHLYSAENLADFLNGTYTEALQLQEITASDTCVTVVEQGNRLVGYAVSGPCKLPVPDMPENSYELRRIYLLPETKGQKLGTALLEGALRFFRERSAHAVYVGVWSENIRAQAFYRKSGFEKVGDYLFKVGEHADDEWIMQLTDWPFSATADPVPV